MVRETGSSMKRASGPWLGANWIWSRNQTWRRRLRCEEGVALELSGSGTSATEACALRTAHPESSKAEAEALGSEVMPMRQSLSSRTGEPRLVASRTFAGARGAAGLAVWERVRAWRPAAGEGLGAGGAGWATRGIAAQMANQNEARILSRKTPPWQVQFHSTCRILLPQRLKQDDRKENVDATDELDEPGR